MSTSSGSNPDPTETDEDGDNEENEGDNSLGLKVGVGLGIPLAIIITALGTWLFLKKRHKGNAQPTGPSDQPPTIEQQKTDPQYFVPGTQMAQAQEMQTWSQSPPQELMGSEVPAHLRQR